MTHANTAFLLLDMQNDLCHEEGIFQKHGLGANAQIATILPNIIDTITFCKNKGIPVIATQMTVILNIKKEAIGLGSLNSMRPFLTKEGYREGTWGHDILEGIPKPDFLVRKWGISAFYETELNHLLHSLQIEKLLLSGFPTNGTVETFAREALSRNYKIITLTDCVTGYSESLNQSSLTNLGAFGKIFTAKEWQNQISLSSSSNSI